ncbi:MAG: DUF1631 family protein [Pseudohongiellaceae bacterium]
MKKIVDRVKFHSVKALTRLVLAALENASLEVATQAMKFTNHQLPPIREESHSIAEKFLMNMNTSFDGLIEQKASQNDPTQGFDETALDGNYFEAVIAMEGMINHARNCDISEYLSFSTRLDSLFENFQIDETNNPLDPEQIGNAFTAAITPMGLRPEYLLIIYREFNKSVFHNLEEVLAEANAILIDLDVIPDLNIEARDREKQKVKRAVKRPTTDAETRAFSNADTEMNSASAGAGIQNSQFEMLCELLQRELIIDLPLAREPTKQLAPPAQSLASRGGSVALDNSTLQGLLSTVQNNLRAARNLNPESIIGNGTTAKAILDALQKHTAAADSPALTSQQVDIINLVLFLFEYIWKDDSLPAPMKELIGSTQVAVLKIALADTGFFGNEQHPARILLDEFAMAGIAWTEAELLKTDPMYMTVKTLSEAVSQKNSPDLNFLNKCIKELREFKSAQISANDSLERSLTDNGNHSERLEDVHSFVTEKINERILDSKLDPSIRSLLDTFIHEFLVKLVLKEGPGGSSWKPVMSTIDVLLWSVKSEKQEGDKERFEKINPRLIGNLTKALAIGGASKSKLSKILRQLRQVQDYSFHTAEFATKENRPSAASRLPTKNVAASAISTRVINEPSSNAPYLRQADQLPVGIWLEFKGDANTPMRCTLAAKLGGIDKMFFVNRQGVKVAELTRAQLAEELKAGSVKIISEGSLLDRAIEGVISRLRESSKIAATN